MKSYYSQLTLGSVISDFGDSYPWWLWQAVHPLWPASYTEWEPALYWMRASPTEQEGKREGKGKRDTVLLIYCEGIRIKEELLLSAHFRDSYLWLWEQLSLMALASSPSTLACFIHRARAASPTEQEGKREGKGKRDTVLLIYYKGIRIKEELLLSAHFRDSYLWLWGQLSLMALARSPSTLACFTHRPSASQVRGTSSLVQSLSHVSNQTPQDCVNEFVIILSLLSKFPNDEWVPVRFYSFLMEKRSSLMTS